MSWLRPVSHIRRWTFGAAVKGNLRTFASATSSTSSSQSPEIFDVVCIGGGPIGLSFVAALRSLTPKADLNIALVESQRLPSLDSRPQQDPELYSNRASSLTPASAAFLKRIGAWQHLDVSRVQPYSGMQVWDGVSGSRIEFEWPDQPPPGDDEDDADANTIAYMLENANLSRSLQVRLMELQGLSLLDGQRVESITYGPADRPAFSKSQSADFEGPDLSSWPHVSLSSGRVLAARLLVGADGQNSPVRTFAGIASRGWDYGRHGVVATLRLDTSTLDLFQRTAYQRFLPTGPIALLPLPGPFASLVWSTTPERASLLKKLAEPDFLAAVNGAFRLEPVDIDYMHTIPSGQADELLWRSQHTANPDGLQEGLQLPSSAIALQPEDSRASFPLRMRHADAYIAARIALIGDAAHAMHPLAGMGMNTGLADAAALADALADAAAHGADLGDPQAALAPYPARRYASNHLLLGVTDKLHSLYSVSAGPLVGLRSAGLSAVNRLAPLKTFLMRAAARSGL